MATAQLQVMVKNLRAEAGHSLSVAQGVNNVETLKYLLARTQEELWTAFLWPELKLRAPVPLAPGQYSYPYHADLPFDLVREVWTAPAGSQEGAHWTPVDYGIDNEDFILADGTNSERSDPVCFWDADGPANFRVWPTPDTSARLRFVGQKRLNPLIADSDVSTLDSTVIVLLTAADLLARAKAEDADIKMQKAQRHLTKLLGNKINAKNKVTTLGGGSPNRNTRNANVIFGRGF